VAESRLVDSTAAAAGTAESIAADAVDDSIDHRWVVGLTAEGHITGPSG